MEKIAISKFQATCSRVPEKVRRMRKPILTMRFGAPVAQVVPPPPAPRPKRWLGDMAGTGKILGDIVSPASDEKDWEALH